MDVQRHLNGKSRNRASVNEHQHQSHELVRTGIGIHHLHRVSREAVWDRQTDERAGEGGGRREDGQTD